MSDDAVEAMQSLAKYDKQSRDIANRAEAQNQNYKRELAIIAERPEF